MSKILFIGDSHIIHCFSKENNDSWYIIDVTLNKLRKCDCDILISHVEYRQNDLSDCYIVDENGSKLSEVLNNTDYEFILFSIGEIDVRYHLIKQLELNEIAIDDLLSIYESFLKKIKKKIIVSSIPPPGIDNKNNYTRDINNRSKITIDMNNKLKDICKKNGYYFFDLYSDFNIDGRLDINKSDGGVHINKSFKDEILNKLSI